MNKLFRIVLPLVAIGIGLLIRQALMATAPELGEQKIEAYVPRINVVTANVSDYQISIEAFGVTQSQGNIALMAKAPGELIELNDKLRRGANFKKGEVLASVDASDFTQNLAIAQAAVAQAQAKLSLEQAAAELAVKDWQRISQEPPSDVTAHKPQLTLAAAAIQTAKAQVALAELNMSRCTLVAPFDGRALKLNAEVGQWLSPGAIVAALLPNTGTEINIPLNLKQLRLLNLPTSGECAALNVYVELPNEHQVLKAVLIRISGELEKGTRMNQAVALLPAGINLPPQTYLEVVIHGEVVANTFKLPAVAVNGNRVQVVNNDSTLHEQQITIIQQTADSYIVRGLTDGQQVSTTPLSVFVPGMQVEVINN
jgi:RND family efflux transporter MFP subunit